MNLVAILYWEIWKARNQETPKKEIRLKEIVQKSQSLWNEIQMSMKKNERSSTNGDSIRDLSWEPPPRGKIKINTNASF